MEVGLFVKVINAGYFHCANNANLSTSEITSVLHCEARTISEERPDVLIMLQSHRDLLPSSDAIC
jgi:hypothetical protein